MMPEAICCNRRLCGGRLAAVLVAAIVAAAASAAKAAPESPFAAFIGEWVGGGEVAGTNGSSERIRCRASGEDAYGGAGLAQSIVCASPSYRIDIKSDVQAYGHNVSGAWREDTRGASGQLTGTISGGRFDGAVTGASFTADVQLQSNGRRQTVRIIPKGADITNVNIELRRRD